MSVAKVAIIGAGAAGISCANKLTSLKELKDKSNSNYDKLQIDLFEKEETYGGLIHTSVLPVNTSVKKIAHNLAKKLSSLVNNNPTVNVRFFPKVNVSLEQNDNNDTTKYSHLNFVHVVKYYDAIVVSAGVTRPELPVYITAQHTENIMHSHDFCCNISLKQNLSGDKLTKTVNFIKSLVNGRLVIVGTGNVSLETLHFLLGHDSLSDYFKELPIEIQQALIQLNKQPPEVILLGRSDITQFKWSPSVMRPALTAIGAQVILPIGLDIDEYTESGSKLSHILIQHSNNIDNKRVVTRILHNTDIKNISNQGSEYLAIECVDKNLKRQFTTTATGVLLATGSSGPPHNWVSELKNLCNTEDCILTKAGWSASLTGNVGDSIISGQNAAMFIDKALSTKLKFKKPCIHSQTIIESLNNLDWTKAVN